MPSHKEDDRRRLIRREGIWIGSASSACGLRSSACIKCSLVLVGASLELATEGGRDSGEASGHQDKLRLPTPATPESVPPSSVGSKKKVSRTFGGGDDKRLSRLRSKSDCRGSSSMGRKPELRATRGGVVSHICEGRGHLGLLNSLEIGAVIGFGGSAF